VAGTERHSGTPLAILCGNAQKILRRWSEISPQEKCGRGYSLALTVG
jgi:hypothetical protein